VKRRHKIRRQLELAELWKQAREASRGLTGCRIPHCLIGGMAVNVYGHERRTHDVDFMIPDIHERHRLMRLWDLRSWRTIDPHEHWLHHELAHFDGDVPIISLHALIYSKLAAFRPKDVRDCVHLLPFVGDREQLLAYLMSSGQGKTVERFYRVANAVDRGLKPWIAIPPHARWPGPPRVFRYGQWWDIDLNADESAQSPP
jgi:hypothetical protein